LKRKRQVVVARIALFVVFFFNLRIALFVDARSTIFDYFVAWAFHIRLLGLSFQCWMFPFLTLSFFFLFCRNACATVSFVSWTYPQLLVSLQMQFGFSKAYDWACNC